MDTSFSSLVSMQHRGIWRLEAENGNQANSIWLSITSSSCLLSGVTSHWGQSSHVHQLKMYHYVASLIVLPVMKETRSDRMERGIV